MPAKSRKKASLKIRITDGPGTGQLYTFPGYKRILVGRDSLCNLCVQDDGCSRRHFEIFTQDDGVWISDLNSANGTRVNDQKIEKCRLSDGDSIQAGNTFFLILECPAPADIPDLQLKLQDGESNVVLSLPQADASLLALRGGSEPVVELERENTLLREVCDMTQHINTSDERDKTTKMLIERMLSLLDADGVCYIEPVDDGEEWEVVSCASANDAIREVAVSRTLIELALTENVAVLSADPLRDERFSPGQSILLHRISSAICCPLFIDGEPIGIVFIVRRNRAETFSEFDLRAAATVANVLALFIKQSILAEESRRKERLSVIGEVVAGLAHYAKNIIMGLNFSIENLRITLDAGNTEKLAEYIDNVDGQQRRLSNLVQDMLNYAKEREPEREPTNLANLLAEAVAPFAERLSETRIEWDFEIAENLPLISADETAMNRVFLNLLTNAIDAASENTAGKGRIRVAMHPLPDKNSMEIIFADNGPGIPPESLPRIFDVMFSTKGSRGTGIGLAVVRKVVDEHGGSIAVQSEQGQGTTFTLSLPLE